MHEHNFSDDCVLIFSNSLYQGQPKTFLTLEAVWQRLFSTLPGDMPVSAPPRLEENEGMEVELWRK